MKAKLLKLWCLTALGAVTFINVAQAQGGNPSEAPADAAATPRDNIYDRDLFLNTRLLEYDHIREADVFFERRVWRIIDVREKMNHPFKYPKEPFIKILLEEAKKGNITLYGQETDEFKTPLSPEEVSSLGGSVDTITTYNPDTFEEQIKVVVNDLNPEDIKRYRVKEVWVFDKETSTLQVRILGIAPILEKYDDMGNFQYETVMFWAYYPDMRKVLARYECFNPANDAQRMTWEQIFEMRFFSSYIMKVSNVYDRRIQDYKEGIDRLLEAEDLKNEIFHFEHDLWVY
jgi:gliding motility associated protien GldN